MNRRLPRFPLCAAWLVAVLLTGCASAIVTKVTNFNQWPADAAGSSFSFIAPPPGPPGKPRELEQATYENYAQSELEKQGLRRAAAGQTARLLVELSTATETRQRTYLQPIYEDRQVFFPPYRNAAGQLIPGFWGPGRFGPTYVGDRVVPYTVQFSQLSLRLFDTKNSPPGQPRTVFESHAVYEGSAELPVIAPYLARAVLDGFPGQNGQVRHVKFDGKTGALLQK
jgi:hypothetical protein